MNYSAIRKVLEGRTVTCHTANKIKADLVFENMAYKPVNGKTYITNEFAPNTKRPTTLGVDPYEMIRGLYIITPYVPANKGPKVGDEIAEHFLGKNHGFHAGLLLHSNKLKIEYTERKRGFSEAPWYYTPIVIAWRVI